MIQNKTIIRWVEHIATCMGKNKQISYDPQKALARGFFSLSNELECRRWYAGIPFVRYRIDPVENKSYWMPERFDELPKMYVDQPNVISYILELLESYSHPDNIVIRFPTQLDATYIKKFMTAREKEIPPFYCNFGLVVGTSIPKYEQLFSEDVKELLVMPIIEQDGFSNIFSDEEGPIEIVDPE